MGKVAKLNKLEDSQAIAKVSHIRISPGKLNLVAGLIRNMHVNDALIQLTFSKKRIARDVKKCLMSAVANAENNHGLDIDRLYVTEVMVGKSLVMKRFSPRARGRAGRIEKFFSNLSIVVTEMGE